MMRQSTAEVMAMNPGMAGDQRTAGVVCSRRASLTLKRGRAQSLRPLVALGAGLLFLMAGVLSSEDALAKKKLAKSSGEVKRFKRSKKETVNPADKHVPKEIQKQRLRQHSSLEDIDDEVDILRELLDIERGSPTEADTLLELSYVLWDRAEAYEVEAYDTYFTIGIDEAEKKKNKALLRRLKIEQQNLLEEARGTKIEVIDNLKRIERRFRRFYKLDEVLYSLGWHLNELKRHSEAVDAFMRLVRKVPKSAYLPDAYLGIGNYYFGKNRGGDALRWYQKVTKYKKSNIYGWALYYIGWVHYNRQDYDKAVAAFVKLLDYSQNEAKGRVTFFDDGTKYLVKSWAEYGVPSKASRFFKKVAPGQEDRLLDALARHYISISAYSKSIVVLNDLIKFHFESAKSVTYLYLMVDAYYKAANLQGTIGAIERLSLGLLKHGDTIETPLKDDIARLLAEIASTFHAEAERTLDKKVLGYSEKIYSAFMEHFPHHVFAYDMLHNQSLALFQLERWRESAAHYERVISMKPNGKYAEPSAHRALICYLRLQKDLNLDVSKQVDDLLNPIPLEEEEKLIAGACGRYVKIAREQKKVEDVPEAIFVQARIYYQHNYFEKSGELFTLFVDNYKDHKYAYTAARLMLSSFNLAQDGHNLIKYTNILIKDPRFNRDKLGVILIAVKENEDYNRCLELKSEPRKAAKCLLDYAHAYPDSTQAIRAYAGAARFYRDAKDRDLVIKTYRALAKNYPKDDRAPKALFAVAQVYQETANFAAAAQAYEKLVEAFPKYKGKIGEELMIPKALAIATAIRDGLGQFEKVAANGERYLKYFRSNKDAVEVAYKLTLQYRKQKDWGGVVRASKRFLKGRKDIPLHLRLAAMSNTALAYSYNPRGGDVYAKRLIDKVMAITKKMAEDGTFRKLPQIGKDAVAQALFVKGELIFHKMRKVRVRTRKLKDAVALATKKAALATEAGKYYIEVENSKNAEWVAAASSRRGRAFQEIAITLENLPPPPAFSRLDELKDEWISKMSEKAAPYKEKAKERYREALKKSASLFAFDTYWEEARDYLKELDPDFAVLATMPEKIISVTKVAWSLAKAPNTVIRENREALFGRPSADIKLTESADTAAERAQIVKTFKDLSYAHYVQGDLREALMVATVGMSPDNAPELKKDSAFLTMLGLAQLRLKHIRPALKLFLRAAEVDPKAIVPLLNRASIQIKYMDLEGAAPLLAEVVRRDPKHYWARVTLPVLLRRLGKPDEAMAMLDAVVADYPNLPEGQYNRCVISQAVLTGTKAKVEKALANCKAAVDTTKRGSKDWRELRKRAQGLKDQLEFMEPEGGMGMADGATPTDASAAPDAASDL